MSEKDIEELKKILTKEKLELIKQKIEEKYNNPEEKYILYFNPPEQYYYSSYHNLIDIFKKEYLWCSHILSQALLHIFDQVRTRKQNLEPVIYRLKLKKINLLKSYDKDNNNIFSNIFDIETIKKIETYFKTTYNDLDKFIFSGEKNKRILYILQIINENMLPEMKFNGYYNEFDQNESAFINDNLITEYKISRYVSTKLKRKDLCTFPINKEVFLRLFSDKPIKYTNTIDIADKSELLESKLVESKLVNFFKEDTNDLLEDTNDLLEDTNDLLEDTNDLLEDNEDEQLESSNIKHKQIYKSEFVFDKYRMICDLDKVEYIEYEDFDTKNIIRYQCKTPKEYYYEKKYIKYKIKYLKLKYPLSVKKIY